MPKYKFADLVYNITEKRLPVAGDEVFYIGLEHLDSGKLKVTRWGSKVAIKGEKLVMKKGDILFGRRNTYLRRVAIAPHDGIFSAHGMIFRPKKEVINEDFFPFFIASDYFMDEAIRISVGSLSPTVNWGELKELEFEIPNLEKQKELAKILVAANQTKENYEELLLKTDELVKSQFIEMFGLLDNTKYPVVTLNDICDFIKDGTHQTPTYTDDKDSGFKFLSSKDITSGYIDWKNIKYIPEYLHKELYARISPQKDDILLAKNGTTGIGAIVDTDEVFDIYVSLALLRFKPGNNIKYIWTAINMPSTKNQFDASLKGVGVPNLHLSEIRKTRIILAPKDKQDGFVSFVDQTDKSKVNLQKGLKRLENTKNMIIQSFSNERRIKNAYV